MKDLCIFIIIGGPYHIATAEMFPCEDDTGGKCRERLYWSIDWKATISSGTTAGNGSDEANSSGVCPEGAAAAAASTHGDVFTIKFTPNERDASNFYLKPVVKSTQGEKYFHIVTDPEDRQCFQSTKVMKKRVEEEADEGEDYSSHSQKSSESELQQNPYISAYEKEHAESHTKVVSDLEGTPVDPPQVKYSEEDQEKLNNQEKSMQGKDAIKAKQKFEPTRYVNINESNQLVVELDVKSYNSGFKLKNPHDGVTYQLAKSQWLPEALRGSQPHMIGCNGVSFISKFRKSISSVYIDRAESETILFGKHKVGPKKYSHFVLEEGHRT